MVRAVRERRRQIGTLRALGFPARSVGLSFAIEAAYVALQGTVIGALLATLTLYTIVTRSDAMGDIAFAVPFAQLGILLLGTVLASLLATVAPALAATRIRPAVAPANDRLMPQHAGFPSSSKAYVGRHESARGQSPRGPSSNGRFIVMEAGTQPPGDSGYPVQFSVEYPDRALNRLTTAFRIIVAIPILIVVGTVDGYGAAPRITVGRWQREPAGSCSSRRC